MASNQAQSSIELEPLSEVSHNVESAPTPQILHTQEVSCTTSNLPSFHESNRASSQPSSVSCPRTQSSAAAQSTESSASTSRWSRIVSIVNAIAAFITIVSFPSTILSVRAALDSLKVSFWTQSKDAFEWCADHDFEYPGCEAFKDKSLPIPDDLSLFGRSGIRSDTNNQLCLPAQRWCWARMNSNPIIWSGIYLSLLFIELIILRHTSICFRRVVRSLLKTVSAEHKASYQELEQVVVLYDSATVLEIPGAITSKGGQDLQNYEAIPQGTALPPNNYPRSPDILSLEGGQDAHNREAVHEETILLTENPPRNPDAVNPKDGQDIRHRKTFRHEEGSPPNYRGPSEYERSYRASTTSKKEVTIRGSVVIHNEHARGYNQAEPRVTYYGSSLYDRSKRFYN